VVSTLAPSREKPVSECAFKWVNVRHYSAAREAKLRLENLDESNAAAAAAGEGSGAGAGAGSSQERTRTAITGSLKMKLKAQMADFQDLRAKLQAEYKEVVERRYFAVTGQEVGLALTPGGCRVGYVCLTCQACIEDSVSRLLLTLPTQPFDTGGSYWVSSIAPCFDAQQSITC
jgi:hypothetical protein